MSAIEGNPENICSHLVLLSLLTRLRHGTAREFRFGTRADTPIYYHCPVAAMPG
jgi:hypothetical protein